MVSNKSYTRENIRFLLWRDTVDREGWVQRLAEWIGCDVRRAEQLLDNGDLTEDEAERLAGACDVAADTILTKDLFSESGGDVLRENLRRLVDGLGHGRKKNLAAALGVSPVTVSRWYGGPQRPTRGKLAAIVRYFDLPAGTDLEIDPLYLSSAPLTEEERRIWIRRRIDLLGPRDIANLFPAFERLLKSV